jgi:predicted transcriptional regulator
MKSGTALLISIRPRFVDQIFAGTKTVELRRVRPRVESGDLVIVYASGHEKALVGAFQIAAVIEATPANIWTRFGAATGLSKTEFDTYFAGVNIGYAIKVSHTWRLLNPVRLETLRRRHGGFHPPQGYRYLDLGEVFTLGGESLMGNIVRSRRKPKRLPETGRDL